MKKILFVIVFLASVFPAMAQLTAAEAFTSAPQGIFPLLDRNTRLDMVDYYKNGMSNPSQNALDGRSLISEMTDESLSVRMTDSSSAQLVVLTAPKGQVIAIISTVATPGLDSNIKFYDATWRPLDLNSYFTKPGWKEWLTESGRANEDEVMMQVPFMLASFRIDPATLKLTLTNNLSRFLDKDVYESLSSYLRPSLVYIWNGKKFTPEK